MFGDYQSNEKKELSSPREILIGSSEDCCRQNLECFGSEKVN